MNSARGQPFTMDAIERLGPWMYEFAFPDGTKTRLHEESLRQIHAVRHSMIFEFLDAIKFDPASTVLDIACNEGFFSFEFARRGSKDVLGIDARPRTIEKAQYVRERLGAESCRFTVGDVTAIDLEPASFDVVLLLGIIYHVEDPIRLLRRAGAVARRILFVETQLTKPLGPVAYGWGSPAARYTPDAWAMLREGAEDNELASVGGFSVVPNASAVVSILRDIGFSTIIQLHPNRRVSEPQYESVDRAMFAALW